MAKKKKSVWKKGFSPKEKREEEDRRREKRHEALKEYNEKSEEEAKVALDVSRVVDMFKGDKPVNELHKFLFFDNTLGKEYIVKIMETPYVAYHKILRPETLTLEELISIAGFLEVNAVWLFCRMYANYSEVLGEASKNEAEAANRFKRAYFLQELSRRFRESESHSKDAQNGTSALSRLLPPSQCEVD